MSIHIQLLTKDSMNQKIGNEILELWNENVKETADCELEKSDREAILNQLEQYLQSQYGAIYIATNENHQIIGFGLASIKKELMYDTIYGQIDEIYVLPAYRRQKIAKRLVDELVNWFNEKHDTSVVNVYVDLENDLALEFWEGVGLEREFFMLSNN
ncbi:GNAT family N-acetyltransferase [Lysinibacillus pakistanensis]|uniref:N-acetyltransferase n=1 Tax=Lysinibacillus pakistanensis TaxID=759811 RepID=A0AAX3WW84_9BACI|nr:N-acetyltransferase [Lysinibacillus pakistanensis]MDM5230056.1 N-acetyltransferase [Lysinibacillus pakistanensis]WHY45654.1 N-acetyltransferase [Lysinibacillus pakistanensis]WHY50662.1 N-acetyltransferase [Lysinibacillus pakistanensis]